MRIRKRLQLNVAVSVITSIVICLMLFLALQRITSVSSLTKTAGDLMSGMLDRLALRNDYIRNNSGRAKEQWFAKHEQIGALLTGAAAEFRGAEDKKKIVEMIEVQQSIGRIFSAIVANREKEEKGAVPAGLAREVEDRLLNQLNMRVYEVAIQSRDLLESTRKARASVFRQTSWEIIAILLLLIAAAILNSRTMEKEIADRVARLREGAAVIGGGNLEHRLDVRGDDELAELSQEFNAMAAKLGGSYRKLENEIEERKQAEKALRESEERLRLLGDNLPESAVYQYAHEPDGTVCFLYFSAGVERLNGVSVEDVLRDAGTLHRQILSKYIERLVEAEAQSARELSDFDMEVPMLRPDGEMRWMRLRSRPRRMADGRVVWDGVQTDITQHKHAEEALRRSEERLRLAQQVARIGSFEWDLEKKITVWSAELEELHGLQPGTIGGRYEEWAALVHPDDLPAVERCLRESLVTGLFETEWRIVRPDGTIRCVAARGQVLKDDAGKPLRMAGVNLDITERKLAEEELRAREADLNEAQRLAHIGSWYWDAKTDVTTGSDELLRIYGFDPATQSMPDFKDQRDLCYPVEDWEQVNAAVQRSLETGIGYELDVHAIRNGTMIWVTTRSEVKRDADNRIVSLRGTVQDITDRKEAEDTLQMAYDELSKMVEERTRELKEKEVLLKEIHHRVKNNLQVISSLVSLQADGSTDETVREVLRDVTYRVRSMALVHEKLYQSADLAHIDFAEYSRGLLGYLWRAHGAAAASIRLNLALSPVELPVDTAVPCGLILNELAGNALKHAFLGRNEGDVMVSLQSGADGRITLSVTDNGVGLPADLDWRQAKSLGLRLVQMLAGQVGASVSMSGAEGTRFEIAFLVGTLPKQVSRGDAEGAEKTKINA